MSGWTTPGFFLRPRFKRNGSNPADMVVLGARVLTCDEAGTRAQAVAVMDGRFAFVGDNRGARRFIGPETRVVNARGRMLVPGFVDAHVHILWVGMMRSMIADLYPCRSLEEVGSLVKSHAADNPDLPFVFGMGWMYDYVPGGIPTTAMLDDLIDDMPAFLWAYDAQTGWTNSRMAELMMERNPLACRKLVPQLGGDGRPTGMFVHSHTFNPFDYFSMDEFPPDMKDRMLATLWSAMKTVVSSGVTTFDELQLYKAALPLILEFRDRGGFDDLRVRLTYYVDPVDLEDEKALVADLEWFKRVGEVESGDHMKLGESLKFYIDGCFGNHTSFFLEPYIDEPGNRGEGCWTQENFDRVIELIDGMGLQACTHSIGDAGIQRTVNSYVRAAGVNGPRDSRHRVVHCEFPLAEDIERMGAAGIYASMEPTQFFGDDSNERVVGIERLQRFDPWRSLEAAGIQLCFGTDWIAGATVPPINPLYGLLMCGTRINYRMETDWAPGEKISLENAIRYYTLGSAKAMFMEDAIGSIEVGKLADFTLWHTNLLKIASWWFLLTNEIEVGTLDHFLDMTVVDGRPVYTREGAAL